VKVVFDSNIFVSALAIPGGAAEQALEAAIEGSFDLVTSRPIISEVLDVLARKFDRDREELSRTALFLSGLGTIVAPRRDIHVLADEPDNRILECALAGDASVIVTGDRAMLELGTWEGIRVITLRDFLGLLAPGSAIHEPRARYKSTRTRKRHVSHQVP